jgi:hypothetical protein
MLTARTLRIVVELVGSIRPDGPLTHRQVS